MSAAFAFDRRSLSEFWVVGIEKMVNPAVSKLWSCGTLHDGIAHVLQASSTLDEKALLRELEDRLFLNTRKSFFLYVVRSWKSNWPKTRLAPY